MPPAPITQRDAKRLNDKLRSCLWGTQETQVRYGWHVFLFTSGHTGVPRAYDLTVCCTYGNSTNVVPRGVAVQLGW